MTHKTAEKSIDQEMLEDRSCRVSDQNVTLHQMKGQLASPDWGSDKALCGQLSLSLVAELDL